MEDELATHNISHTDGHEIPAYTNYAFAVVYIICMMVGIPGNLISLQYFITCARQNTTTGNKTFFNNLYILTSLTDLVICVTLPPVIVSFMYQRGEGWFACALFCQLWGVLWEMLPYISVFFVGIMSISRTAVLIKPLWQLNTRLQWILTVSYCIFLILRTVCPIWLNAATYEYVFSDVYCYELPTADWSYKFNSISRSLTLAAPVIPICISCTTSYTIIVLNERRQARTRRPSRARLPLCKPVGKPDLAQFKKLKSSPMNATMTILIFTIAYIVFNIPVFVNYLLMSIAGWSKNCVSDCYHKTYQNHPALIWYSWNFTYITCVALNSTVNPMIYYWRMPTVKEFVNVRVSRTSRVLMDISNKESEFRKRVSNAFIRSGYQHQTLSTQAPDSSPSGNIPELCDLGERITSH